MKSRMRSAVIKTEHGPKIVKVPQGTRHNMEIAAAPLGFEPGHEAFMKVGISGRVTFDHAAMLSAQKASHHKIDKTRDWNGSTPLERFKKHLRGNK